MEMVRGCHASSSPVGSPALPSGHSGLHCYKCTSRLTTGGLPLPLPGTLALSTPTAVSLSSFWELRKTKSEGLCPSRGAGPKTTGVHSALQPRVAQLGTFLIVCTCDLASQVQEQGEKKWGWRRQHRPHETERPERGWWSPLLFEDVSPPRGGQGR